MLIWELRAEENAGDQEGMTQSGRVVEENRMHQGSCLCGVVKYRIESDLKAVVHCHCQFCRRAHGSAFTTLVFVPFAGLTIVAGAELIERYPVERLEADRCFCRKCGTRLYNYRPSSGMISIIAATLDTAEILRPIAHCNTESKCSWFEIKDELPQFPSSPGPGELGKLIAK